MYRCYLWGSSGVRDGKDLESSRGLKDGGILGLNGGLWCGNGLG